MSHYAVLSFEHRFFVSLCVRKEHIVFSYTETLERPAESLSCDELSFSEIRPQSGEEWQVLGEEREKQCGRQAFPRGQATEREPNCYEDCLPRSGKLHATKSSWRHRGQKRKTPRPKLCLHAEAADISRKQQWRPGCCSCRPKSMKFRLTTCTPGNFKVPRRPQFHQSLKKVSYLVLIFAADASTNHKAAACCCYFVIRCFTFKTTHIIWPIKAEHWQFSELNDTLFLILMVSSCHIDSPNLDELYIILL